MLFQPTNVLPSTWGQLEDGVVDLTENVDVSWQVNGNSPMTKYQIDFFLKDEHSTPAVSTGVLTLAAPFYGRDSDGNVIRFTQTVPPSFLAGARGTGVYSPTGDIVAGSTDYTTFGTAVSGVLGTYRFVHNGSGWKLNGGASSVSLSTYGITISGSPSSGDTITVVYGMINGEDYMLQITQYWGATDYVKQSSKSVFYARSTPSVSITAPQAGATVTGRTVNATGSYTQAQGEDLNWVRWQLAVLQSGVFVTLQDTWRIYGTSLLAFSYSGLENGKMYAVKLQIQTETGREMDTGWNLFSVSYTTVTTSGTVSTEVLKTVNGIKVTWPSVGSLPGINPSDVTGFDVYRTEEESGKMVFVASVGSSQNTLIDCAARNDTPCFYSVYVMQNTTMAARPLVSETVTPLCWDWTVYSCTGGTNDGYRPESIFRFGKNLKSGTMGNGNEPNVFQNFTQFPTVHTPPWNARTGSLENFIGYISNFRYSDTTELRDAIYELSVTLNTLFLKDRKGSLWKIAIDKATDFTTEDDTAEQAQKGKLNWMEIGDASDSGITIHPGDALWI